MVLVNDIGVFSMYASEDANYKTFLERNVTSILATNTYYHKPPSLLVQFSTTPKVILAIKKSFDLVVMGPWGSALVKKRER